ncbi:MAG: phosphoglycerate kinase [Oligoflexales bacterium]|nr:phosphoglycerate kinase [Oligoflexales bacterium]
MAKKTIKGIDFNGKRTFIRCDFNVPLDSKRKITNDLRIRDAIPTIKEVLDKGGRVILASHLGRPEGERKMEDSLAPVAERLTELLGKKVPLLNDCIGEDVEKACNSLKNGEIVLLENLRFHKAETAKDQTKLNEFGDKLSKLADVYVGDAFGCAHRAHASIVGLARNMPAYCGYLMAKELEYFGKVIETPERPVVAILGGAKVSDKILLIENLLSKVDTIIIGGGMAYTFQYALGRKVGKSLLEIERVEIAKEIMNKAKDKNVDLILPVDTLIADDFSEKAKTRIEAGDIPEGWQGVDVGPKSIEIFKKALEKAKTVVWNGPVGVFEIDKFAEGTKKLAEIIGNIKATTIIGGGDTASAAYKFGIEKKVSHVSTGGGASLELLEGKVLPGVACLLDNK